VPEVPGVTSFIVRNARRLALACMVVWLPATVIAPAQTPTTETCPPPSPPATSVAPNTSSSPGLLLPAPGQLVACVGSQPITGWVFRHWAGVAKRALGRRPPTHAVIEEAMGFLISSDWVIGEARDLNIHLSEVEVRRYFDRIRREQFPKRREFTAFLKSSGQTVADLLFRVQLNLLSARIQRQIIASQHGTSAQEHAIGHFVSEFKSKWRAQTYCAPPYAVGDCGHVQTAL
jgi:hypothetical protein